ncbi:MAG: uroporphyrinogen decarboxylase [Elusimicrobia bacterium]|nr:uroporphyrinogen decarboxylase [Elusimicrobiota bacterium]
MTGAERFLAACRGRPVDVVPVWLMRQAGRYLPEYRVLRRRHGFLEMCKTPELAVRATLQPVERLGVDAAILFSDILVLVEAMGVAVRFEAGSGPVLEARPKDMSDIRALKVPDPPRELGFTLAALRALRGELAAGAALIGFVGLPFTLASYIVEGGKSEDFAALRAFMADSPEAFAALMDRLAEAAAAYGAAQLEAGAQALQLFDTWAGILEQAQYESSVLPYTRRIAESLARRGAPIIHFCGDCRRLLPLLATLPVDVLSIDSRVGLDEAARLAGPKFALQGNLDPRTLLAGPGEFETAVAQVLRRGAAAAGHVFNLGHGVPPQTEPERVARLVELVHRSRPHA